MDKKEREIFEEVINSLKALQARVEALENEVAGLKGFAEPAGDDGEVIDIEFDDIDIEPVEEILEEHEVAEEAVEPAAAESTESTESAESPEPAEAVAEELVEEDRPVEEEETVVEVVEEKPLDEPIIAEGTEEELEVEALTEEVAEEVEEVTEAVAGEVAAEEVAVVPEAEEPAAEEPAAEEPAAEENVTEADLVEDLPEEPVEEELFGGMSLFGEVVEPKVHHHKTRKTLNDSAHSSKAVIDVMADKLAWKHDMPGSVVKDIKSAISLNDRVLFISSLFREDSMLYQDTMSRLNAMASLDEAVSYLTETFPEWKLDSDSVYRFMMAVRRKLR